MYHINMHAHSTHSDGTQPPEEIVRVAYYSGMKAVVITEHDVISSIPNVISEAFIYGLDTITGVEFSSNMGDILAFGFDPANERINKHIENVSISRNEHTKRALEASPLGYEWERVVELNPGCTWFCNNQIFNAMMADGIYGVHDYDGFWDTYKIGEKKVEGIKWPEAEEVIRVIKEAGGIPVMAHPKWHIPKNIPKLIEMGIRGFETIYPNHTEEEVAYLLKLAADNNLYITGGTDLHGLYDSYYVPFQSYGATKEWFENIKYKKLD